MFLIIGAIILGLAQMSGFLLASKLIVAYSERKQAEIVAAVNNELTHLVNGEPCQSASVLLSIGQSVGREAGRSAKAAIMGDLAQVAKAQNTVNDGEQLALIQEANPNVGAILSGMGKRGGKMLRNPLVQLAISALTSGQTAGSNHGVASDGESVKNRLQRGQG